MSQKGLVPLLIVLILAFLVGGYLVYQKQPKPIPQPQPTTQPSQSDASPVPNGAAKIGETSQYQTVKIKELINDTNKYDGQKILVQGRFTDMTDKPLLMCVPRPSGNPELRNVYRTYPSTWGISNQDGEIGVDVIDENGVHNSSLPNYKQDWEIWLKGIARTATVTDNCITDIRYNSVYIEVKAEDIDITLKPLPKEIPQDN